MKPNPVVHFEMGYNDADRMSAFYEKTFNWGIQKMGAEMGNYVLAETSKEDPETHRPKEAGAINGGFYKKSADPMSHAPSLVIAVEDIAAAMKAIEANGGKILGTMDSAGNHTMEPQMIPNVGLWISAMDTEENRFSILQPKM